MIMSVKKHSSAIPDIPLRAALVGQNLVFAGLQDGGLRLAHRLAEIGLTPGAPLEVINRSPGPFIVAVRGARLVLGRGMVQKILVRPT